MDFVEQYNGDQPITQQMLTKLLKMPPPKSKLPESEYVSTAYNDRVNDEKMAEFAHNIVQKSTIKLNQGSQIQEPEQIAAIFGCYPTDITIAMKQFMFKHATLFDITQVGACTERASYAALSLAEAFKTQAINVAYTSNIKKNQFAVILGNKEIGFYVYDPLTNPELIFSHAYYTKNVLSQFPDNHITSNQVKVKITSDILEEFEAQKNLMRTRLATYIQDNLPTLEQLYHDRIFHFTTMALGYDMANEKNSLNEAVCYLKQGLGSIASKQMEYNQSFTPQHDLAQNSTRFIEEPTSHNASMKLGRKI